MLTGQNRYTDKLTVRETAEAFGLTLHIIHPDKQKEILSELSPVYDRMDEISNSSIPTADKEIAQMFLETMLTKRERLLFNSLTHMRKVMNMTRMLGIGGRRDRDVGMAILPLEEAKNIDFVQIHDFQKIKNKVSGFTAICPLHADKSPSFSVKRNRFMCFGCGKSGSTIDFVMHLYGFTFVDAVKWLTKLKTNKRT